MNERKLAYNESLLYELIDLVGEIQFANDETKEKRINEIIEEILSIMESD